MPEDMKTDAWVQECATEGCPRPGIVYFEHGGVGSTYCPECMSRVRGLAAVPTPPVGVREEVVVLELIRGARERFDQIDCQGWGSQSVPSMAAAYDKMQSFASDGSRKLAAAIGMIEASQAISAASVIAPVEEMDLWPDDPAPIADKAADHVFKDFAKALGLETWHPQDGSESWEGDVWATAVRMLEDAGVLDPETGKRRVIAPVEGVVAWQWSDRNGMWYAVDSNTDRMSLADQEELARAVASSNGGTARPLYADPRSALVASPPSDRAGATHRHVKRGTEYVLLGIGKMQTERWREPTKQQLLNETICNWAERVDMREVAIYRSVDDGSLWVRPWEEFEDGRFEALRSLPSGEGK